MLSLQVCSRTLTSSMSNNSITLCGIVLLDPPQVARDSFAIWQKTDSNVVPVGKD